MIWIASALSLGIGTILGMLGGGGAILTLPMLVYVLGVPPKAAVAMSLFFVGTTSIVGTTVHARSGNVRWTAGLVFGAGSMAGAFAGGRLAHYVPGRVLLIVFGAVMILAALAMFRGRKQGEDTTHPVRGGLLASVGAVVGILAGLVGAGGGFLIVPALTLIGGLAMRESIGTSLFVITLQSFAGFVGHGEFSSLNWNLLLVVTTCSIGGSLFGIVAAKKVSPERLGHAFAMLVASMGTFLIYKEFSAAGAIIVGVGITAAMTAISRNRIRTSSLVHDGRRLQ